MQRDVEVRLRDVVLLGALAIPDEPKGVVLFAHGSGSSRLSPRNSAVARTLNEAGFATLLFDLLTDIESRSREKVFDIGLLAQRLVAANDWIKERPHLAVLPMSFFGASTGAAAALVAAAHLRQDVAAVVSRGGRPDLAASRLSDVTAPTLLIVGGEDTAVLEMNKKAAEQLRCEHAVEVVKGAGHLFEEPGTLEKVAELATGWFTRHATREDDDE